jgi:predicted DNA-binding transcriptional regulator AlpA
LTDGPRLIGRKEAAAYLGIAESTFSMWVAQEKMPQPVLGTRKWDKKAIDAHLDEISGLATPVVAVSPKASADDEFKNWERKQRVRDKHRPLHNLDAREERILRFMIDHPEYMTTDAIPNAGEKTMEDLMKRGVVRPGGKDHAGSREWFVTDEGRAEIVRTDTWRNW